MNAQSKEETLKIYFERINKIVNHINLHLDESLDIQQLSEMGMYSSFHFHRIMRAYLREPIGAYIIRIRLETSAHLLKMTNLPINEIAMKVGYENPSSYNKAFKKRFAVSPADYRGQQQILIKQFKNQMIMNIAEQISTTPTIKHIDSMIVIYAQALGPYSESAGKAWETVCKFAAQKKLYGFKTAFIGISHDSPDITEAEKLRYDACITVRKHLQPEGEIGIKEIQGGKYAIFRHKGSYEKLNDSYNYIYGTWMPENGIELDDKPSFELYLNSPDKTKPEKLLTDIYIPIK